MIKKNCYSMNIKNASSLYVCADSTAATIPPTTTDFFGGGGGGDAQCDFSDVERETNDLRDILVECSPAPINGKLVSGAQCFAECEERRNPLVLNQRTTALITCRNGNIINGPKECFCEYTTCVRAFSVFYSHVQDSVGL